MRQQVVNTAKLKFTKDKMQTKTYYWHTGYMGGLKTTTPDILKQKGKDSEILARAVRGMIPKNRVRVVHGIPIIFLVRCIRPNPSCDDPHVRVGVVCFVCHVAVRSSRQSTHGR